MSSTSLKLIVFENSISRYNFAIELCTRKMIREVDPLIRLDGLWSHSTRSVKLFRNNGKCLKSFTNAGLFIGRSELQDAIEKLPEPLKECCQCLCGPGNGENSVLVFPYLRLLWDHILKNYDSDFDQLSVQEQGTVRASIEVFICVGFIVHLEPGVGKPLQARSNFQPFVAQLIAQQSWSGGISEHDLNLLKRMLDNEFLRRTIISKYLGDVVASCLQYKKMHSVEIIDISYLKKCVPLMMFVQELMFLQSVCGSVTPSWFKGDIGMILTECLLSDGGLLACLNALIDMTKSVPSADEWQKWFSFARVVVTCPKIYSTRSTQYYTNISQQIVSLFDLSSPSPLAAKLCVPLACIVALFASKKLKICQDLVLDNITEPLRLTETISELRDGDGRLTKSFYVLSTLLCSLNLSAVIDSTNLFRYAVGYAPVVLTCLAYLHDSVTPCLSSLKLLAGTLISFDTKQVVGQFIDSGPTSKQTNSCHRPSESVRFVVSETGNIAIETIDKDNESDMESRLPYFERVDTILGLIGDQPEDCSKNVVTNTFLLCIEELNSISQNRSDSGIVDGPCSSSGQIFIEMEHESDRVDKGIIYSTFLLALFDRFSDVLILDFERQLQLCTALFKFYDNPNHSNDGQDDNPSSSETILFLFTILNTLCMQNGNDFRLDKYSELVDGLISALNDIVLHSSNSTNSGLGNQLLKLIKQVSMRNTPSNNQESEHLHEKQESDTLECALRDISDPALHVKGHGIIVLCRLIEMKDLNTMKNMEKLNVILLELLENEDSYVYLAAINAISALGLKFNDVIHVLARQLASTMSINSPEVRLKIGESLVKIGQEMGDLGSFHGEKIISPILMLCKDSDETVRASALSNLAELCRLMRFRLSACIEEIFECVNEILKFDKCDLVRRGAIFVVFSILKGCSVDMLEIVGDRIRDTYKLLKWLYNEDKDETVRLHAQVALEQLNENMKDIIKKHVNQRSNRRLIEEIE